MNKLRYFWKAKSLPLALLRILLILALLLSVIWVFLAQPTFSRSPALDRNVDPEQLQKHVHYLSVICHPRSSLESDNLNRAADYIAQEFEASGGRVWFQEFEAYSQPFRNVRCLIGEGKGSRIVVGAHYDSYLLTPGADDNASGVAGLIELGRLLAGQELEHEIELVAYTLEEPPAFATEDMGSVHHAQSLQEEGVEVLGVIVLEMIGYFSDEPGSQDAPAKLFKLYYPSKGNFIAVIGNAGQRPFARKVKVGMKGATPLPVVSVNAPRFVPGIDFSDHRNYWPHDWQAVMISNSAFYRNEHYHGPGDTWDILDYERMAQVVLSTYSALLSL